MIHADWAGMLVILVSSLLLSLRRRKGLQLIFLFLLQTQGTNEAVADLGRRLDRPGKTPFRLLRERSRPGEM